MTEAQKKARFENTVRWGCYDFHQRKKALIERGAIRVEPGMDKGSVTLSVFGSYFVTIWKCEGLAMSDRLWGAAMRTAELMEKRA